MQDEVLFPLVAILAVYALVQLLPDKLSTGIAIAFERLSIGLYPQARETKSQYFLRRGWFWLRWALAAFVMTQLWYYATEATAPATIARYTMQIVSAGLELLTGISALNVIVALVISGREKLFGKNTRFDAQRHMFTES
ncbi:MAG: hypothetical protein ACT4QB_11105 [Gammaproteobacteria bacterium]